MIPIGAITDEFSDDLETALNAMSGLGMTGVELRVVSGRNVVDLSDDDIEGVRAAVARRGMRVVGLASPVLKCVLPSAPAVDSRFQQDVFGAPYTYEDQARLAARAFEIAERTGATFVRVFSYWRTVEPDACYDRVAEALRGLADEASRRGLVVGLENEAACNVATGAETARILATVEHPALQVVWDPANALVAGETPFPDGYGLLPPARIAHVHAKDCHVKGHQPEWGPIGEMGVDWTGQIRALARDGYDGWINLETHWRGPHGDKLEASTICALALRAMVEV